MEAYSKNAPMFIGDKYRITILSEGLIRFEYSNEGKFLDNATHFAINRDFEKATIEITEDSKHLVVMSKYFTFQYTKEAQFEGNKLFPDNNLRVKLNGTDKMWHPGHPETRNFASNAFAIEDVLKPQLDKSLYSTDGFVSIDDSKGLVINAAGNLEKRVSGNTDIYLFLYKRDFASCLKDYYKLTGHPPLIPKYALGIWWNRDRVYSETDVFNMTNLFTKYDIPLSVFLLSEFWHTKDEKNLALYKSGYAFNQKLFQNPDSFIKILNSKNIKLGVNFDPSEGITVRDECYKYFHEKLNPVDGAAVPFDLFNETFVSVFKEHVLQDLANIGINFLWLDYKEKKEQLVVLNYLVNKINFNDRSFALTRNIGPAAHRYSAMYSGQTVVSWNTLNYLPSYNAGAANHGLSWWSHDVGGYKDGTEDNELYLRYVQFSVFSPIFRFSSKGGQYYKREPWVWDIKTLTIVRRYCDLRYRLIPYLYTENFKSHKYGAPLIMPIYYQAPSIYDEPTYKNEYHFGTELLIAAITKPLNELISRSIERIYLPEGIWYDFNTGKKFIGDKRYITFYKDEDYPIFAKAGAIIPLTVLTNNKNDLSNPQTMEINVFPGASNIYQLYEDDGETLQYESGEYFITIFDFNYKKNNYAFSIKPGAGNSEVIPKTRNYIIKFRNTNRPDEVNMFLNGNRFDNYEGVDGDSNFVIRIYDVPTDKQLTINCIGENIELEANRIFQEDIKSILFDLEIDTNLKDELDSIIFREDDIKRKRIEIKKLSKKGLNPKFITMFLKLLEYSAEL